MPTTFSHPELAADSVSDALAAAGFELSAAARVSIVVLDTFDGRLHDAGLRLELWAGAETTLVLLDLKGAPPAQLAWDKEPRWPSELPPGPFRTRLAGITRERALMPVLTIPSRVRTARRTDRRGKVTVRAELHDAWAIDGEELPSWLLVVDGVAGHGDDLERVITRLGTLGLEAALDTDLAGAVAARCGLPLEGRSSSPTVPLAPQLGALRAFRRVLLNLSDTIEHNLDGTVQDIDVEFLHELRVAVRRTRSVLAQGKGVLPSDIRDRYREDFGWLGQITGPARDLDVYLLRWDDYVEALELADPIPLDRVRAELEERRQAAHAELAAALRCETCSTLLDSWRRWLVDPDVVASDDQRIGPVVAKRIAKAQDKVLTGGRAITDASPPERLHDLRKDTKKLRYLLECFGSLFPSNPRKAFVTQLKALQDNLGEHQDAEVHLAQLRELAHDLHARASVDTDALLAMGRLSDHLDRRRAQERDDFVERFAAYDTKANRRTLKGLLEGVAGA